MWADSRTFRRLYQPTGPSVVFDPELLYYPLSIAPSLKIDELPEVSRNVTHGIREGEKYPRI